MPINTRIPASHALHEQFSLSISRIFDQAQISSANHQKNFVTLHKVHMEAAGYTEETPRGTRIVGETQFQKVFSSYLFRILSVKKGVTAADRMLKFIGGYIKFINEKALGEKDIDNNDDADDNDETTASRFTAYLLEFLLSGFLAKDKTIRFRVLFTLLEMISHMGEIDEDAYNNLRNALMDRTRDREASVRSLAATCLSKLAISEDPSEYEEGGSILDTLISLMTYDFSPDVRRAVIMNIPVNARTLPAILDRTRDTDQPTRKVVYGHVLAHNLLEKDIEEGNPHNIGPTHPQILSIDQRELIIKNGLGDRDIVVRKATELLISKWMEVLCIKIEGPDVKLEDQTKEIPETSTLALLKLFDLHSDLSVPSSALMSIFTTRPDIFNEVEFPTEYWSVLTPEKAFFARVYVDYCKDTKDDIRLEAVLPVVTSIAFRIQEQFNTLMEVLAECDGLKISQNVDDELNQSEDRKASNQFIISELLKMAVNLDYSDEIGRRKTFQLVRDMLGAEELPEALMAPCLDVLRVLSGSERDLIRLVVETVTELRDNIIGDGDELSTQQPDPDQSFDDTAPPKPPRPSIEKLTPEKKVRLDVIDIKCLKMCIAMLERVNSTFDENITLEVVLKDLIYPSTTRREGTFRELGIKALGLCCLIARKLAVQSLKPFISSFSVVSPNIRLVLAQTLIDIFMAHENVIFNDKTNLEMITEFLLKHITKEEDPKVQAVLCQGTAKLVISGMITDIEVIKTLLKAYISPSTTGNEELRQCLIFFFKIYSHSSPENQERMREIFILIFLDVCEDRKNATEAEEDVEIIESGQLAAMFIEWTDPIHLSNALAARNVQDEKAANACIQLDMAKDIITLLFEKDLKVEIEKEDKRVLCQLLNKFYVPDTVDDYRIRSLKLLMINLNTRRPLRDTSCKTALAKFEAAITKKFEKQLEHFSEEEFRQLEQLQDLFMFLDSIIPLDDDELTEIDIPRRGRKRRSESVISTTTGSHSSSPGARKSKGKSKAKRPRLSTEDGDDDEEDATTESTPQPEAPPTRTLPKRAAASRKPPQVIVISSDSEEYEEPATRTRKNTGARFRPAIKEEAQLDRDLDSLLNNSSSSLGEVPYDSIMDSDPDSAEENEVNDLLAED